MKRAILFLLICFQWVSLQASEGPVVCIHGFMTKAKSMMPIRNALRACCFDVYLWEYPSRRRYIREHACCLVYYLQEVASCNPGQPIDFVTHSTGALILRAALNMSGCPEEAKMGRAVLMAPPNQGSSLARRFRGVQPVQFFMGYKSGCELASYDVCDVMELGCFPESMQVLVIAGSKGSQFFFRSPNDGYLTVDETALDTPFYWEVFPVTHGDLLVCPQVLCSMRTFLMYGCPEPDQESDSVCPDEVDESTCSTSGCV